MRNFQETGDMPLLARSRSVSVSSDAAHISTLTSPPPVDPSPAFIAATSAAQIVSVDMEQNEVIPHDGEGGCISPNSLLLLNCFLDYLLFSILASAKSTELSALRPAIADVLKPRLAREVVAAADEELGEYMGGSDEDELQEFRGGRAPHGEFDLVRAWKLARLRCMVYTRLGDMEEEEEDEYIAREGLDESGGAPRRFSGHAGNITPAAAIFLTSIIEYLGEHALVIAGENARNRVFSATRLASRLPSPEGSDQKMMVEESDMEKLALNGTLGRLWRTWKKGIRQPTLSRSFSRESFAIRGSSSTIIGASPSSDLVRDPRLEEPLEEEETQPTSVDPADIALPLNDRDIDEIEVPGLWVDVEEAETMQASIAQKVRPRSLIVSRSSSQSPTSPKGNAGTWPATNSPRHNRSQSVPVHIEIFKPSNESPTRETKPSLETVTENEGGDAIVNGEPSREQTADNVNLTLKTTQSSEEPPEDSSEERLQSPESLEPIVAEEDDSSQITEDHHRSPGEQVVEGQGTYQRPDLNGLSIQRPKRRQTKDSVKKQGSETDIVENRDVVADHDDDHQPTTQGADMMAAAKSTVTHQNANHADGSQTQGNTQTVLNSRPPTSHPRQLETNTSIVPEESTNSPLKRSPNPSQNTSSSTYAESIGHSPSDDSEGSVYRSISSRAASHAASIRSQPRQDDLSAGRERVAVQRVYVPTTTSQASIRSRRSTSISEKRPHTSGSGTSSVSNKLKVLIGRHPGEADVPLPAPPRSSSDASRFGASDDSGEAALEELINSDETIRFTLTPRTMREIEMPGSPRWNVARNDIHSDRANTSDLADFLRTTAPPGQPKPSPRLTSEREPSPTMHTKPSSPMKASSATTRPSVDMVSETSSPTSLTSAARPTSRNSGRSKLGMQQAREARVGGDSVREIAHFIRATGPHGETGPNGHIRDGSESMVNASRPETAQSFSSRTTARPRTSLSSVKRTGPRLQARDPAGHDSNKTSALIDFIREGPPGASTHRIPRTVAPFRNTMDSEDLVFMEAARDRDTKAAAAPSLASTGADSAASSRAPLLSNRSPSSDAPMVPQRKRRGPRDPYAIDISDEEEDEEESIDSSIASKPARAEESLLDFLNSVPPSMPQKDPEPFILTSHQVPQNASSSSGQVLAGVKNRFRRNTVTDKTPTPKKSMSSMRSSKPITKPQISSPLPQSGGFSAQQPTYTTQSTQLSGGGRGLASKPSLPALPRTARQTETGALADFLKNTAPPESFTRSPTMMSEDKKDSTFSKLFRRKRLET